MVAAADATADSTMHREYVIDTNISNNRVVKVLPDTGSTPSIFVGGKIVGWIESVEHKLSSDCYLPSNKHHNQPTTDSMTGNGAHTVVRNKNEMFNFLLFCKLKQSTKLLTSTKLLIDLIQIQGPPSLRRKLWALCEEYSDIFDTAVKIDETKWKSNKYRLPPRTHSVEKQSQIRQQCDKLLE